jgi:ankyrin repeat protein
MARKFMSSGMRALLIHIFKQLPQQPVNRRELRSFLTAAATAGDRVCVKLLLKHKICVNSNRDGFDTALGCAAENGHIQIMKDLLDAGADVDCREFQYRPQDAMVKAIIGGHTSAVKLLARHGADLTRLEDPSFLMLAIKSRSLEMVACLLELGLLPESDPDALMAACSIGDAGIVLSLFSAGATVKQRVGYGSHHLPLYKAAQGGHLDIVNLLLQHGADPNLGTGYDLGFPLVIAASKGHLDIVKTLLVHGANPDLTRDTVSRCSQDETEEFLSESEESYIRESSHKLISPTALDEACRNSDFQIVEELLSHQATITDCLANICHGNWSSKKTKILELLVEAISAKDDFEMAWKRAASQATAPNNTHLIEMLSDYVPTSTDLLVLASACGSVSTVRHCLAQCIGPNGPDEHGFVPLSSAARGLHREVVRLLVSEGADVNQVDVEGQTALLAALTRFKASLEEPLHEATHANTTDIEDTVRCLVNAGAQLMVGDPKACETLELACSTGHIEIVAQLLAIRKVGDWSQGLQTWLFAAIDGNYPDIVSTLLKEGADPYKPRLLPLSDYRARLLVSHDGASDMQGMISQRPFEAALGRGNSCLLRVFLASLPEFRISNEALIQAAEVYVAQSYLDRPESATSSDLATILDFDLSLVVPKDVLRILADGHADKLLELVISRSEYTDWRRFTDRRRFTNRSVTARAPPLVSQAPDMLRQRILSQMQGTLKQRR